MIHSRWATSQRSGEQAIIPSAARDDTIDPALRATPVLVVEDEVVIAWTLETLLEEMGFTDIRLAASAAQALTAAAVLRPGLVLSDINLGPGEDGIDTATRLQRDGALPVVFVSGYAGPEAMVRIERGVPGAIVLRKPVQIRDLRRAVVAALAMRRPH